MTPLYLIAEIYPDPEKLVEAQKAFDELISSTLQEPGCMLYDLVVEQDSAHWMMLEKWESREAWNLHMQTEHVRTIEKLAPKFTIRPTVLRFLRPAAEKVQS